MAKIFRSESHALATTPALRSNVSRTVEAYRRAVRALCTIMMTHWPEISSAKNKCFVTESFFHPTSKRPVVRYAVLDKMLGKMPSYLRRAAIESAYGVTASFLSNYSNWLNGEIGGKIREKGSRTPTLGVSNVYPPLYGGNMITYESGLRQVRVKLLRSNGQWTFSEPLKVKGRFKRILPLGTMELCPSLIIHRSKVSLSCPVKVTTPKYLTNKEFIGSPTPASRVCAVDVGINTAAVATFVDSTGTVIAAKFLTCGRHNDRRDALGVAIAEKRSLSVPVKGQKHCSDLHRRITGLSLDAARSVASDIAAFAAMHGATIFVIEYLKGWRPKGPSRAMRKRFHRFQHRALVKALTLKAQEMGARVLEIYARGTSSFAYDGSGKVSRSKNNAQLATFTSGKQYNADLNASLNIAARGLAMIYGIKKYSVNRKAETGKSSGSVPGMPLVLADIWAHAQTLREPSNQPEKVGV